MSRQQPAKQWFNSIHRLTEQLVAISTISPDVQGESECADLILTLLTEGDVSLEPHLWPTDDGQRHNVACLLHGCHPANRGQTIILLGHYDTVGIEEFRTIDPNAYDVVAFSSAQIRTRLKRKAQLPPAVQHDLQEQWCPQSQPEPVWMFGRGTLDMKSGLAALIAVMRQLWCERSQLAGNILFLACPDEENESAGILSAIAHLVRWREKYDLIYLGVINADYTAPRSNNDAERYIYTGTIGKLLPAFYILGDPTHVGEPFRGIDAGQIAATLLNRIHLNPNFSDTWSDDVGGGEELTPPPTVLRIRDLKRGYNVQTSAEAFVYINWLTYTQSPQTVLDLLIHEAKQALCDVFHYRADAFTRFVGKEPQPEPYDVQVLTFADLVTRFRVLRGWTIAPSDPRNDPFEMWLQRYINRIHEDVGGHPGKEWFLKTRLSNRFDSREFSRLIVFELIRELGLQGPAIVLFFAPPYYPHIRPQNNRITTAIKTILTQLDDKEESPLSQKFYAAVPQPAATPIALRGYYPYISDLSFVWLDDTVAPQLDSLRDNMPLFRRGYWLDFEAMTRLNCSVVSIGPFGKDAHGLYERVHMPYSFEVVPQLIYETIYEAFK